MKIDLETLTLTNYCEEYKYIMNDFKQISNKFINQINERLMISKNNKEFSYNNAYVVLNNNNNNKAIGYLFISLCKNDEVYLEYAIIKDERKKGYASRLVGEITNYLCENYNLRNIKLNIDKSNIASQKVAEKCGFIYDFEDFETRNYSGKIDFIYDNPNYINKRRKI